MNLSASAKENLLFYKTDLHGAFVYYPFRLLCFGQRQSYIQTCKWLSDTGEKKGYDTYHISKFKVIYICFQLICDSI
jgi:hypothetical protein